MSGNYKRTNSSLFAICHEVVEGAANYEQTSDSLGTTTTFVNSAAVGVDDEWNGYYLYAKDGANAGLARKVTGFVASSGTFTTEAFPNAMASGVNAVLALALPAKVSEPSTDTEKLPLEFETPTYDKPGHIVGLATCSGSFDLESSGCETPATTSVAAVADRQSILLQGIGAREAAISDTVQASPSPTTTTFTITDGTRLTVGRMVMVNGAVRMVSAINANAITVKPALPAIPTDGDEVKGAETFYATEEGQRSFTMLWLRDDQLTEMRGCKINVKGTFKWGNKTMLQIEFKGTGWDKYDGYTLALPQSSKKSFAWITGAALYDLDSVISLPVQEADFDFGADIQEDRDSVDGNIQNVVDRNSSARLKFRTTNKVQKDNEVSGKVAEVLCQMGGSSGGAMAFWMQGQYESVGDSDNAGIAYYDGELKHLDPNTDEASAQRMMFARW